MEQVEKLLRKAGKMMLDAGLDTLQIDEKSSSHDIVTNCDTAVQNMVVEGLKALVPDAGFLCEEGNLKTLTDGVCFIIDPIDGTTNFAFGAGHSCIAVAMTENRVTVKSWVYNPWRDEMFTAEKGMGAFLNGIQLKMRDRSLKNSLVHFGTAPYTHELWEPTFALAKAVLPKCMDLRRPGTAELDLCAVAAGRCGVYFEYCVFPWDQAAGSLIVQEAGGVVTTLSGEELPKETRSTILAATPTAWKEFRALLQEGNFSV